ncbi:MAG: Na/Pi cotransporter family protein [Lentisphaerae bacterium]|nr:Na/Pi cotransporter family protein [Lentisphaerota bacterium]
MKDMFIVLLTVAGGLGTFLLGMKHLSEGLQAVSGRGLRRFMALATTHRLAGIATGCVSTVIVQSSSIITVIAVGFVSSGLLDLTQAINVIIGSNIGTTTTAWIIAFVPDVGLLGLSVVALGAVFYFFINRETAHNFGLALMGLGFVFMGLYWMNEGVAPLKQNESVRAAFAALDAGTVVGLLKCFAVSIIFTAVVQSSAATTAIAMTLSMQGVISFETAAATVFGMNIGTTVTAWLAAFGSTTEAKRTAMAHTLFNVVGTVVLIPLFIPVMLPVSKALFPNWATSPAAPMAAVHTGFNIVTTLLFFPFVRHFARFVTWLVPAKTEREQTRLTYLNKRVKQSPQIACEQAAREVLFMANSNVEMMANVRAAIDGTANDEDVDHVFRREGILDRVQQEITEFLGRVMTSRLPEDVASQARSLLRITDELETISDEECTIIKALKRFRDGGGEFAGDARSVVLDIQGRVAAFAAAVNVSLEYCENNFTGRPVANADELSDEIRGRVRDARQAALLTVGSSPMRTLAQLDILNAFDRMRSCYLNISQTLAGGKHV